MHTVHTVILEKLYIMVGNFITVWLLYNLLFSWKKNLTVFAVAQEYYLRKKVGMASASQVNYCLRLYSKPNTAVIPWKNFLEIS